MIPDGINAASVVEVRNWNRTMKVSLAKLKAILIKVEIATAKKLVGWQHMLKKLKMKQMG